MVKMMSQDKMIGKREILSSSPSPWLSRFLRTMLLLLMITAGASTTWGQTDLSGTYYIATVTHSENPAENYYLCPTEEWYYDNTTEYTSTPNDKPFLTTYKCRATEENESKAIWVIQKHPTLNYYYIKHGSQYLTYNDAYFSNEGRVRVHLEDNPEDDDYALFAINYHSSSKSYEIFSKYADDNDTYIDTSTNKERKYLNINKGNKDSFQGKDDKVNDIETGGIIGLWTNGAAENQGTGRFYLEEYFPRPTFSSSSKDEITISHSEENMTIYYTTDDSSPTTTHKNGSGTAPLQVDMPDNAVNLKAIAVKDNLPTCISSIRVVPNATVTLDPSSFTYNGSAQEPTVTVKDGNTTISSDEYTVGYNDNTDAGDATVTITNATGGTFIVYGSATFTISPKPLTITANPKTITYGDAPANDGVTYGEFAGTETSAVLTGTLAYDYNYEQYGDAGDYAITPSGLSNDNYDITFVNGTLTVNPKEVGLTWSTPTSFPYDGSSHAPTANVNDADLVNGDVVGVTVTPTAKEGSSLTDGNAINAGSYTATASSLTGEKAGNYTLPAANTADFTISPASLAIVANNMEKAYGTADPTLTYTMEPETLVSGNTITGALAREAGETMGTYAIQQGDLSAGSNYTITFTGATFTITKGILTVTAKSKTIIYGDEPANGGVEYEGFASTEDETVLEGTLAYACDYTQYGDAGNYTITPSGLTATNYNITFVPGTLTVNPKEVELTWSTPTSFDYDGEAHALTANASGMVNGDEIGVTVTTTAKEGSSLTEGKAINAGSYTATASSFTGDKAGNYTPPVVNTQDFTIAKIGITPTVTLDGWTYGETAATPSVTGNTENGAVTYTYKVKDADDGTYIDTQPTNAGTYTVKASIAATTNYEAASATADFTIEKAILTASVTLSGWTYGETAATPSVTENTGNGAVTYTYKVKDADDGTYTETQPSDAGTYTVKASIAATTNYEAATVTSDFAIAKATLVASVTLDGWTYGETAAIPSVTGNTENGAVTYMYKVKETAEDTYTETQPTDAGSYTVKVIIATTTNYLAGEATADFTISPKSIGDGTTPADGLIINVDNNNVVTITGLTEDTDFTVSGPVEEDGNQLWTIKGIGNYKDEAKVMRIVLDFYNTGVDTGENVKDLAAFQPSTDLVISGKDVYIVTDVNLTKNKVVLSKIAYAPKDKPVLLLTDLEGTDLKTTAGVAATPIQVETGDEADTSGNILKRVSGTEGLQVTFGKVFLFYLGKFVLTTEGTLEAGSFYFDNPNPPSRSAAGVRLSIVIDETTDIDGIKEYDNTGTAIDRWYSLDGRRLNGKPTKKGLYIKNGQKVVVK